MISLASRSSVPRELRDDLVRFKSCLREEMFSLTSRSSLPWDSRDDLVKIRSCLKESTSDDIEPRSMLVQC